MTNCRRTGQNSRVGTVSSSIAGLGPLWCRSDTLGVLSLPVGGPMLFAIVWLSTMPTAGDDDVALVHVVLRLVAGSSRLGPAATLLRMEFSAWPSTPIGLAELSP